MAEKLDLLKIAPEEQTGDLFKLLDQTFKRSKVQPRGISDAIIWEGGNPSGNVKPVAHAFTDMFALNGTLMALDVLGLPFLGVPMMAQFRHDTKLVSLEWFGKMDNICLKWSTAGDFMVNDNGKKVVVAGKSANAPPRAAAPPPVFTATGGLVAALPAFVSCRVCRIRRTTRNSSSTKPPAISTPR